MFYSHTVLPYFESGELHGKLRFSFPENPHYGLFPGIAFQGTLNVSFQPSLLLLTAWVSSQYFMDDAPDSGVSVGSNAVHSTGERKG